MKNTEFLKNAKIAHRGFHDQKTNIPENSILSYKNAIYNGYAIELDLTILEDGNIVCFHDDNTLRLTGIDEEISKLVFSDIEKLFLLNTKEKIPLFTEMLLLSSEIPLLIEIKYNKNFKKFKKELLQVIDQIKNPFAVFSFDPRIVYFFKKHRPKVIRGQISSYFIENTKMSKIAKFIMKRLFLNFITKPDFISYNCVNLPNKYVDREMRKGKIIISYTARNREEYMRIKSKYHNIVFENFTL